MEQTGIDPLPQLDCQNAGSPALGYESIEC